MKTIQCENYDVVHQQDKYYIVAMIFVVISPALEISSRPVVRDDPKVYQAINLW